MKKSSKEFNQAQDGVLNKQRWTRKQWQGNCFLAMKENEIMLFEKRTAGTLMTRYSLNIEDMQAKDWLELKDKEHGKTTNKSLKHQAQRV